MPSVNTGCGGTLMLKLTGTTIEFEPSYENLLLPPAVAHITSASGHVGVMVFFSGGDGQPACPVMTSGITAGTTDPRGEIAGEMLKLLKQAAPKISRAAMLTGTDSSLEIWPRHADSAAKALGLPVQTFIIGAADLILDVLADIARTNQDALLVSASALPFLLRRHILDFAVKQRLPGVYPFRPYADDGGLIAYGVDLQA